MLCLTCQFDSPPGASSCPKCGGLLSRIIPGASFHQDRFRVNTLYDSGRWGIAWNVTDTGSKLPGLLHEIPYESIETQIKRQFGEWAKSLKSRQDGSILPLLFPLTKGNRFYVMYEQPAGKPLKKYLNSTLRAKNLRSWMATLLNLLNNLHSINPPIFHSSIDDGTVMVLPNASVQLAYFSFPPRVNGELESELGLEDLESLGKLAYLVQEGKPFSGSKSDSKRNELMQWDAFALTFLVDRALDEKVKVPASADLAKPAVAKLEAAEKLSPSDSPGPSIAIEQTTPPAAATPTSPLAALPPPKPVKSRIAMIAAAIALIAAGGIGWQVHLADAKRHDSEIREIQDRLGREQKAADAERQKAAAAERERARLAEQRLEEQRAAEAERDLTAAKAKIEAKRLADQKEEFERQAQERTAELRKAAEVKAELEKKNREQEEVLRKIDEQRKAEELARQARPPAKPVDPQTGEMRDRLSEMNRNLAIWRSKFPIHHTIKLTNECAVGPISVAVNYMLPEGGDRRVTQGWYVVPASQSLDTGVVSRDSHFYYYAERPGRFWSGEGKKGSIGLWVVSNPLFVLYTGETPSIKEKRMISFFGRQYPSFGVHELRLSCTEAQKKTSFPIETIPIQTFGTVRGISSPTQPASPRPANQTLSGTTYGFR